jgi:hypothetical protein
VVPLRSFAIILQLLCSLAAHAQFSRTLVEKKPLGYLRPDRDASLCKGPEQEYYICHATTDKGLIFKRSVDGGRTWTEWKTIGPFKADTVKFAWPNKVITCDTNSTAYKGRIYVCWSDAKNGTANKDVFLMYSDDRGDNWTEPILVTYRPNHRSQFDPAIAVDKHGRLYISYFDQQNYIGQGCDFYLAVSNNGGLAFSYYNVAHIAKGALATNQAIEIDRSNRIQLRWYELKKKADLQWLTHVNDSILAAYSHFEPKELQMTKSFGFADRIILPFYSGKNIRLDADITKPLEPGFRRLVFEQKRFRRGNHSLNIDTRALGLPKGNYILTLYYRGMNSYVWILAE